MSYGYSQGLVQANKTASAKHLGVALGRLCIAKKIPVVLVAKAFGVSRMTVYNWFKGATEPLPLLHQPIRSYIETHKTK